MIEAGGAYAGSYESAVLGASWVSLTSEDFIDDTSAAGDPLPAGLVFVGLMVGSTTNATNVKYCAMPAAAASAGRTVAAGASMSDNLHGLDVDTVSVRGGGAGTTVRVWASFVRP